MLRYEVLSRFLCISRWTAGLQGRYSWRSLRIVERKTSLYIDAKRNPVSDHHADRVASIVLRSRIEKARFQSLSQASASRNSRILWPWSLGTCCCTGNENLSQYVTSSTCLFIWKYYAQSSPKKRSMWVSIIWSIVRKVSKRITHQLQSDFDHGTKNCSQMSATLVTCWVYSS